MNAGNRFGLVVGVDGSSGADAAIAWAVRNAAMHGDDVTLLMALCRDDLSIRNPDIVRRLRVLRRRQAAMVLVRARSVALNAVGHCREPIINDEMVFAGPADALTGASVDARMIVIGRAGRRHRSLAGGLGSVSGAVTYRGECPVAVIPDCLPAPLSHAPILLGIDGTEASEVAIAVAFDEASRRRAPLTVVHALTRSSIGRGELSVEGREVLSERLAGWRERYPDVLVTSTVVTDRIKRWLIEHSAGAQLVVVGSRDMGAVSRFAHRSVSARIVEALKVPVIVARGRR